MRGFRILSFHFSMRGSGVRHTVFFLDLSLISYGSKDPNNRVLYLVFGPYNHVIWVLGP